MNNLSFWLLLAGFVLFCVSIFLESEPGMAGPAGGWTLYPSLATSGQPGSAIDFTILALHVAGASVGLIVFIVGVIEAFWCQRHAGANPWGTGATTLEWTLSSPPPYHSFATLPRIQ